MNTPAKAMSHREQLAERKAMWSAHEGIDNIEGGVKCPRCYRLTGEGRFNFDGLCDRCCGVILKQFPAHWSVDGIKRAYAEQRKKWGCVLPNPPKQG
jgi:hypothetical protein